MSQDQDAMEKAAEIHAQSELPFDVYQAVQDVDDFTEKVRVIERAAFKAGWQAAHQGPKVLALKKRLLKLEALEQAGVDNWDGYGDAMDLRNEWLAEFEKESGT